MKVNQRTWILIIPALLIIAAILLMPFIKEHKKRIIETFNER
jgi:hypothetical protein